MLSAPARLKVLGTLEAAIALSYAIFGRHMLDRLWEEGPGSGPVAMHRGRMMIFSAPAPRTGCPP